MEDILVTVIMPAAGACMAMAVNMSLQQALAVAAGVVVAQLGVLIWYLWDFFWALLKHLVKMKGVMQ